MVNLTSIYTTMALCTHIEHEVCLDGGSILDSDIDRYEYGFQNGGVYHDDDAHFKHRPHLWPSVYPNLPWDTASLVVGVEFPLERGTGPPGCCLQFVQWVFASQSGSLILKDAVKTAKENVKRSCNPNNALDTTGPAMFTNIILNHIGPQFDLSVVEEHGSFYLTKFDETIIVLPYRAFGVHPLHKGSHIHPAPTHEQLVRHEFKGRWRRSNP